MQMKYFKNRVALVTGASRNIGRSIALGLGALGASVMVHAHKNRDDAEDVAAAIRNAGGNAEIFLGNLADPAVPEQLVQETLARFGALDTVVANAAVRPHAALSEVSYEDWRHVMSIALDSVFLLAKASADFLALSDRGAFISIGGLTGHTGAKNRIHVITAKAGLSGLTKGLAHELGSSGVTVNCVAPGLIETTRAGEAPAHHSDRHSLLRHLGSADDVAGAVISLAGPHMRYVTGQTIHVNGGVYMS